MKWKSFNWFLHFATIAGKCKNSNNDNNINNNLLYCLILIHGTLYFYD